MNELFVRLFLAELRKAGFTEAVYDEARSAIIISPQYSRLFVSKEDGEYLVSYNEESKGLLGAVKSVRDAVIAIADAWERSQPVLTEKPDWYRNLIEWNGVTLATRDRGLHGFEYVTWRYDSDRKGVRNGNYTDDVKAAMTDFVKRSGLIPKERLFDDAQLEVIRAALAYRLENDGDLYPDSMESIRDILYALEEVGANKGEGAVSC